MNQPSRGRKVAFWLLVGMISVVFVEVPAGSTMFPFFTVWGLLVVLPLYLLHSVFLAGLVFRFGRPDFWPLFAAGMLYGMYEAYITKVLWISFRPEGPYVTFGGIAFFETILLVFFLHPMLACSLAFTWRGFLLACGVATVVTTISRLLLFPFASFQVLAMFSFYVLAGLFLFTGSLIYAWRLPGARLQAIGSSAAGV